MKTQNLKTNIANIAIRVVRAFNVPIRAESQQPRIPLSSAMPFERMGGSEYFDYGNEESTFTTVS